MLCKRYCFRSGLVDFGLAQFINSDETKQPVREKPSLPENPELSRVCKVTRRKAHSVSVDENVVMPPRAKRKCLAEINPNVIRASPKKKLSTEQKKSLLAALESKKMPRFGRSCNVENISLPKPSATSSVQEKFQFMSLTSPTSLGGPSTRRSNTVTIADVFPSIRRYSRVKSPTISREVSRTKVDDKSCNCFGQLSVCYKCLAR